MRVHGPFWLARCARGVYDHESVFGIGDFCLGSWRLVRDQVVPPKITAGSHLDFQSGVIQDDDMLPSS